MYMPIMPTVPYKLQYPDPTATALQAEPKNFGLHVCIYIHTYIVVIILQTGVYTPLGTYALCTVCTSDAVAVSEAPGGT